MDILKKKFMYLFIFGCAGFSLLHGLFTRQRMGATLQLPCRNFSWPGLLLLPNTGSRARGLPGSRAQAQ